MDWDHDHFARVFNDLYPGLCRFLECLLAGGGEAQEIAQETFLRLYRKSGPRIPDEEVRYWVYRVARNLAVNQLKKRSARMRLLGTLARVFTTPAPGPEAALERAEQEQSVLTLLSALPSHQRAALLLREQEEMSYREIARVLEVSESKVKIDIFRARKNLKQAWTDIEETTRKVSNGPRD